LCVVAVSPGGSVGLFFCVIGCGGFGWRLWRLVRWARFVGWGLCVVGSVGLVVWALVGGLVGGWAVGRFFCMYVEGFFGYRHGLVGVVPFVLESGRSGRGLESLPQWECGVLCGAVWCAGAGGCALVALGLACCGVYGIEAGWSGMGWRCEGG